MDAPSGHLPSDLYNLVDANGIQVRWNHCCLQGPLDNIIDSTIAGMMTFTETAVVILKIVRRVAIRPTYTSEANHELEHVADDNH